MNTIAPQAQVVISWLSGTTGLSAGTILLLALTTGIAWAKRLAVIATLILVVAVFVFGWFHGWFAPLGLTPDQFN